MSTVVGNYRWTLADTSILREKNYDKRTEILQIKPSNAHYTHWSIMWEYTMIFCQIRRQSPTSFPGSFLDNHPILVANPQYRNCLNYAGIPEPRWPPFWNSTNMNNKRVEVYHRADRYWVMNLWVLYHTLYSFYWLCFKPNASITICTICKNLYCI
jgi:hypothetical protein